MKLFDFDHPFFLPLWRRIAIVLVCLCWGGVELMRGAPIWAAFFIGMGGLAARNFLITFDAERIRARRDS